MPATLVIAAHGTRSAAGTATTRALVNAVRTARPDVPATLCFLDVAAPSLPEALDELAGTDVVVVPLLLSAGYHVQTDIPAVVRGRADVRVARHLGPDPLLVAAVGDRVRSREPEPGATVLLAAIGSTRDSAQAEVACALAGVSAALERPVELLPLGPDIAERIGALSGPVAVATYLLAEGGFLDTLRAAVGTRGVVADPIGVHPSLVELVWARYDEARAAPPVTR